MAQVFVPKESEAGELRVAASPETVKALVKQGLVVTIETGAGFAAGFADPDYSAAGARIENAARTGLAAADLVLRVRAPREGTDEVQALRPGAVVVCSLQPALRLPLVRELAERRVTSFAMDLMPRITRAQRMDILSSQATAAGYQAVLVAAATLPRLLPMLMTAAGTIPPSRVLVMGAGVAGLQAIATARRLGAVVEATDVRAAAREQVESLGGRFVDTSAGIDAEAKGGYAKELTSEQLAQQRAILQAHVSAADVVITTALVPGRKAPVLVTAEMIAAMKPGSVVVDLAAEMGGNVVGTVAGQRTVTAGGVTIVGDVNLSAQKAQDASRMFARNLLAFTELLTKGSELAIRWDDECVAATAVTHDGQIKHKGAADALAAKGAS